MRAFGYLIATLVLGTALIAMTPTSTAAAYCVAGVANSYPNDSCDGIACLGYDQNGWMVCVPDPCTAMNCSPHPCEYRSDCCTTTLIGPSFGCPEHQ